MLPLHALLAQNKPNNPKLPLCCKYLLGWPDLTVSSFQNHQRLHDQVLLLLGLHRRGTGSQDLGRVYNEMKKSVSERLETLDGPYGASNRINRYIPEVCKGDLATLDYVFMSEISIFTLDSSWLADVSRLAPASTPSLINLLTLFTLFRAVSPLEAMRDGNSTWVLVETAATEYPIKFHCFTLRLPCRELVWFVGGHVLQLGQNKLASCWRPDLSAKQEVGEHTTI
eukprot:scaffold3169_cov107-Cylindrotheca_fusiformis.AAC.9